MVESSGESQVVRTRQSASVRILDIGTLETDVTGLTKAFTIHMQQTRLGSKSTGIIYIWTTVSTFLHITVENKILFEIWAPTKVILSQGNGV